jgi:CBS domain-containing protein
VEEDMTGTVLDWMSRPAIVVDPEASVTHALTLMRRREIHSLVVDLSEGGHTLYGIVTATDIRDKIIAADRNPAETTVRAIMTAPVIAARPDWTLRECSVKMQAHNIHHLPVIDAAGLLIGLISATDLFIAAEERGWSSAA